MARVLIVEDQREVADLMRAVLVDEGYQVLVHHDGDCLHAVQSFAPDVILCDYMLPARSGRSVLTYLRDQGLCPRFVLTSASREAERGWREWGADDFLAKPFDIDGLVSVIDRVLGRDGTIWTQARAEEEQAS